MLCVAPISETETCRKPASTTRVIEGLDCHLCDWHGRVIDAEAARSRRRGVRERWRVVSAITDQQIEELRKQAAEAGDLAQVWICDLALHGDVADPDTLVGAFDRGTRARLRAMQLADDARVRARAECARLIADAAQ